MTFLKTTTLVVLAGCTALVIFASTHPHDANGTWIRSGSLLPRAQQAFSKAMAGDRDSYISVWYNGEILVGYLGENSQGVIGPVPLEYALRIKTPEHDGFNQDLYVQNPPTSKISGHRYLGLISDGTEDMRSRLVLGMQTVGHIPATEFDAFCEAHECFDNSTYASQVWHVDRESREILPAYSSEDKETDLGIVFERQWTGELNLAMKDVPSETRLIIVPAQDRNHRTL